MNQIINWDDLPINLLPDDIWRNKIIPIGKQGVYNLCHRPDFPSIRIGKKFIIPKEGLKNWLEKEAASR
ncbi:MAG: hypothetical protein A4E52_01865 [Pelotomaculum sp. PtaB.Bin013]|uniref:Helix-turn-helix domain-containing protein n=1 Tax=Pelotomaculum isophthalicicum JI TaxID=947010 RepID=A0A9X4H8N2_9FIRM|nr:helix-turn-helix domain-containing protein [Pelotomaculum isophthalicicum]MDF9409064.1 helix-turn-helix domain-containing protein [Pelotomaculum isophthalicicum JI]OPX83291.1 MAG: hypothetical protein A4E52_01865 [Pelotomaculum sp. PtaB.Bin013]